jgi:hypothetical protein
MSRWSFAASFPVILLGVGVWLGAGGLCYTNWLRSGRRENAAFLEGLRFVLVSLLAFTLLRPELVRQVSHTAAPAIAVLCDVSGSMQTRDVVVSNTVMSRAEWLAARRKAEYWRPLEQGAKVIVEDFGSPAAATNTATARAQEGTDLNRALETVLQRERNLKAVLLLTDGDWNQGKSPVGIATRYRDQNIPVFAVAVGRETPVPDLVLESVTPPSYGLFGEQVLIPFKVQSHLPREVKTTISLRSDGQRDEAKKEIVIPPAGELQDAILWSPRAVGEASLTLKLPVEPDEALPDNNQQSFRIAVRLETLKVLVVDSLPRWEYRYLRNALARDPGVEMNCLLFHPGMSVGAGRQYLPACPNTKEEFSRYDVVFLGDVGIGDGELTAKQAELIKGLVEQQASGLVFLPGRRGRELTLANSALRDLMPVVLDAGKPQGIGLQNESALLLSSAGARHWLTRLESDENRNAEVWKMLPGFYWSAAVEKSRPGAEVLAVHSALRNAWGRMPLLVTRSSGSGQVLFMGTDSAWRWRRGVEDKYHYRFWSQVVRWMAHQRHISAREGIRLSFSPESPQVGDTVYLQATLSDAASRPTTEVPVAGQVLSPLKRAERLEFSPVEGGWGVFKASFMPQDGGTYKMTLTADRFGRKLETDLVVGQPQRERLGRPINLEILRELASITRGGWGTTPDLDKLVQQISLLPEPKPMERRIRLWSDPWWGGFILVLLGIYWTGRKLAGMV